MAEFTPLSGIRIVEFSHMIMGPTCGMILADLGADVVKIERTLSSKISAPAHWISSASATRR
jgi:crotonobetainyl-CoA:carnitine CoA-transferase CaiB-like acyl-CoA transferase